MKCPVDQTVLLVSERQGVEIDYCPECRGVWLDRGELDKIIEANQRAMSGASTTHDKDLRRAERDEHDSGGYSKRGKKDFLGELFDF